MGVHIAIIATKNRVENLVWYVKGINKRNRFFPNDLEQCVQLLPDERDLVTGHVTSLRGEREREGEREGGREGGGETERENDYLGLECSYIYYFEISHTNTCALHTIMKSPEYFITPNVA